VANPQAVSNFLGKKGLPTVAWTDRFKVEGVSCRRGPNKSVEVIVDFEARSVRNEVETQTIAALVGAGWRVTGSGGVLWVNRGE
jgi:hypothetical protein